jgi:hypothetical protein
LRKKKSDFPTNNAMMFTIKNDCIPGFPNWPAGSNHDFSEDRTAKRCSRFDQHIQGLERGVPGNVQSIPAVHTKGTFQKEMKATFFTSSIAKYTGVILKEHIFFLLSMFLVLSASEKKARRRICVSQCCVKTRARKRWVRQSVYLEVQSSLSSKSRYLNSICNSSCLLNQYPSQHPAPCSSFMLQG